jgi:Protein of unknown function (DUF4019)
MRALASIATLAVLIGASPPGYSEDTPEVQAEAAALTWLALVDAGDYQQSWVTAADHFQNSIEEWQWVSTVSKARGPLRAVKRRTVSSVTFVPSLPGAPGGEHFVIQFATNFRKKTAATETVTLLKNLDGRWRVSGYYIR